MVRLTEIEARVTAMEESMAGMEDRVVAAVVARLQPDLDTNREQLKEFFVVIFGLKRLDICLHLILPYQV